MTYQKSTTHVLMSKAVARAYLERVGMVTSTLTVYFNDERQLSAFTQSVQSRFPQDVEASRGFDHVTFVTQRREVAASITDLAQTAGLDISGF